MKKIKTYNIGFACFLHEAHSFSNIPTTLDRFREHHFALGAGEMRKTAGTSTEMAGVWDIAPRLGLQLHPIFHAFPVPGAPLTAKTFNFFCDKLVKGLRAAAPLDGILLNLHGAMIAENALDAEGEFLRIARKIVGPKIPIVATLDCHANVSELMVDMADALIPYDTNPHVDCYARGVQAARLLRAILDGKAKPCMVLAKPPLIPVPQKQNTGQSPMKDVHALAFKLEKLPGVINVGVALGYAYSDVPEAGMSIIAITQNDPKLARTIAEKVARKAWTVRRGFIPDFPKPAEAVAMAIRESKGPVILVETGDNVGAGSAADATALLAELLRQKARDAVVMMRDVEAVNACFKAGIGATVRTTVGGKTDAFHGKPVKVTGRVRLLSDGRYVNRGPMHCMEEGVEWQMGRCAVLECGGVTIPLTEFRVYPRNVMQLKSLGIQPEYCKIIVIKAAHSFRPSYEPIAAKIIEVDTPGLTPTDLSSLPFRNIKRRLFPLHPDATLKSMIISERSGGCD